MRLSQMLGVSVRDVTGSLYIHAGVWKIIQSAAWRAGQIKVSSVFMKILTAALAVITSGCATTAATGTVQLRGHYTWGHEVRTFRPCGSGQSFWVVGDAAVVQPLQEQSTSLARAAGKPYQPLYVEVSAIAQGRAADGFAADHDGVYRFTSVHVINSQSPADCPADG